MYLEKKNSALYVHDLVKSAKGLQPARVGFPYRRSICRCSNCLYSSGGKCALKVCCCMEERIFAHTCSFGEVLRHCFAEIGNASFRYRLRLAMERGTELHSCFLSPGHGKRFREGLNRVGKADHSLIAQIYLLAAHEELWQETSRVLEEDGVVYSALAYAVSELDADAFELYLAASVWKYGAISAGYADLSDEEAVSFDVFRAICYSVPLGLYGMDAVKVSERKPKKQKCRKRKEGKMRERDTHETEC